MHGTVIAFLLVIIVSTGYGYETSRITQEPEYIISTGPIYEDFEQILNIHKTHVYGVYEPYDSPETWSSINNLSPGPDGGVLVTDYRSKRVDLLVPGKGVVVTFGHGEGEGPGEFRAPRGTVWDGQEKIHVHDRSLNRISVFGADGEYQRSFNLGHQSLDMAIDANGVLWVAPLLRPPFDQLTRYDLDTGSVVDVVSGGRYENESWIIPGMNTVRLCASPQGILVGHSYPYEIVEYTLDCSVTRIFGRKLEWLRPMTQDERGVWGQENGTIRAPACFPDGRVIVYLLRVYEDREENRFEGSFDLFDREGRWLTNIPQSAFGSDGFIQAYTAATDGALWIAFVEDWPTVQRFEFGYKSR